MKTTINFEKAYQKLNPEQKIAVDSIEGPVMVLAGPGTGKTQVLAVRIGKILLETQVNPINILCLTFTETGATEMRSRLINLIGPDAYYVKIQTFHSFCNDVISDFPEKFISVRALQNITDVERLGVIRGIIDGLPTTSVLKPFGSPYFYLRDIGRSIADLKREGVNEAGYEKIVSRVDDDLVKADVQDSDRTKMQRQKELANIYLRYQEQLQVLGKYDYEDMILFVVEAFKKDKNFLMGYQEKYQYFLIDEYQDTNSAQNEVISLLGNYFDNPNIFVVGDDDQSIFRFQGASLENILFFEKKYPGAKIVVLNKNYRSSQLILDSAGSLISHNQDRAVNLLPKFQKNLVSQTKLESEKIEVWELSTERSENYFVALEITKLLKQGVSPNEIAVLYRNNTDPDDLIHLLLRLEIPFKLEAGKNVLDDVYVNQLIRLLEYIVLPNDNNLFFLLNCEFLGFDKSKVNKITRQAHEERISLWDCISTDSNFKEFYKRLGQWRKDRFNKTLLEFFDQLIKESGYLKFVIKSLKKEENLNRLSTLFEEIKQVNQNNRLITLEQFLDHLNAYKRDNLTLTEHSLETNKKAVRLMTVHKAKGTEFEHVFIIQTLDKHWGNVREMNYIKLPSGILKFEPKEADRNEDERRLFYVALTRAKKKVYISFAKTAGEKDRQTTPSQFLSEIDSQYLIRPSIDAVESASLQRLQTVFLDTPNSTAEDIQSWVGNIVKDYRLNVTDLNHFLECPRKFYFQSLIKVPSVKTKHQALGTAIHCALRDWVAALQKGDEFSELNILSSFKFYLERELLGELDSKESLEFGNKIIRDYFAKYSKSIRGDSLVEYDFSPHNTKVLGVPITGRFDRIDVLDSKNKKVRVVDYKTGNPDSKNSNLKVGGDYHRQIVFYQILCDNSPKFGYKMSFGEINFIQPSKKTGEFVKREYEISSQEVSDLTQVLTRVYDEIKTLKFLEKIDRESCGKCEFCQFFSSKK